MWGSILNYKIRNAHHIIERPSQTFHINLAQSGWMMVWLQSLFMAKEVSLQIVTNDPSTDFLWPFHQLPDKSYSTTSVIFPSAKGANRKAEPRDSPWSESLEAIPRILSSFPLKFFSWTCSKPSHMFFPPPLSFPYGCQGSLAIFLGNLATTFLQEEVLGTNWAFG